MAILPPGMIIFAAPDDKASFNEAVALIKARGYSKSQIRMFREDGLLMLEALVALS